VVYVDPEDRTRLLTQFAGHDDTTGEFDWKRKDGSLVSVRLSVRVIRGAGGEVECYEGLVEDVTQQRSLENQFRQSQRMEAVGRPAGGVAHDFNNVLTAIMGYSDLLLGDLGPEDPKRADVQEIRAAAQRAAALTRQLLAFSRKQVLQPRVLDLNTASRCCTCRATPTMPWSGTACWRRGCRTSRSPSPPKTSRSRCGRCWTGREAWGAHRRRRPRSSVPFSDASGVSSTSTVASSAPITASTTSRDGLYAGPASSIGTRPFALTRMPAAR
jgi:hypothetical protein